MSEVSFDLNAALAVLERTPAILDAWLAGLPESWLRATEGEGEWSPYEVLAHLIHGERTDWLVRVRHVMAGEQRPFDPFDRTAHLTESEPRPVEELLTTFGEVRRANLSALREMALTPEDLDRTGQHPDFGEVTLGQLLASWMVHDLNHLGQIAATMAREYTHMVGPWHAYLGILNRT